MRIHPTMRNNLTEGRQAVCSVRRRRWASGARTMLDDALVSESSLGIAHSVGHRDPTRINDVGQHHRLFVLGWNLLCNRQHQVPPEDIRCWTRWPMTRQTIQCSLTSKRGSPIKTQAGATASNA